MKKIIFAKTLKNNNSSVMPFYRKARDPVFQC